MSVNSIPTLVPAYPVRLVSSSLGARGFLPRLASAVRGFFMGW